jgi:hypothetical protein
MLKLVIILVLFITETISTTASYEEDYQNASELFVNFKPESICYSKQKSFSRLQFVESCKN